VECSGDCPSLRFCSKLPDLRLRSSSEAPPLLPSDRPESRGELTDRRVLALPPKPAGRREREEEEEEE